jgi:hypothetical protein
VGRKRGKEMLEIIAAHPVKGMHSFWAIAGWAVLFAYPFWGFKKLFRWWRKQ